MKVEIKHIYGALKTALWITIAFFSIIPIMLLSDDKIFWGIVSPILIFLTIFSISLYDRTTSSHNRAQLIPKINNVIEANQEWLAKESLKQTNYIELYQDYKGRSVVLEDWVKTMVDDLIKPTLTKKESGYFSDYELREFVRQSANKAQDNYFETVGFYDQMTGVNFEHFCMKLLIKSGWSVETTKASNDQGVDLIARKTGLTIGVQCKKYSRAVGNRAVQEISAGVKHYSINIPVVVSNQSYTKQAIELAGSTGVHLIHFSEIETLYNTLLNK